MTAPRSLDRILVEGPIAAAVWSIAWPTMIQNILAGLQGVVDHALVGNFVGFTANAAIGVSWQIFLVVMVFISSLFTGMGVLAARFAGAGDKAKVNLVVYQAFLTAAAMALLILAPIGYFVAPSLLTLVHATPAVRAEALPFLRIMFTCSFGMLVFFMLGGAMRSAGDAKTPLRMGIAIMILNIAFNIVLIRGLGPIPALGTAFAIRQLFRGAWVVSFKGLPSYRADWEVIRGLFRFGLPAGVQGIAMNVGGVLMLRYIGSLEHSAEAQAAWAVSYVELFSFITWTSLGLMGAAASVAGQNLGAGKPDRAARAVSVAAQIGLTMASGIGLLFFFIPRPLLLIFGMTDPAASALAVQLLGYLAISGLFVTVALSYTGGLQGTGDTKSPLYISIVSQVILPLGICATLQAVRGLQPSDIWLAVVLGHATCAALSVVRFRQGKWRAIEVKLGASTA